MTVPLYLTPKMGLIPEVSAQNYETLAKALREYISNALDARAKNVWITFSRDASSQSTLDIRDDGQGMGLEELRQEFLAVGGSKKFDDARTIGRIGIGFLAIVPFCETIEIYTKSAGGPGVVEATVETDTMLPQEVRFSEISKTQIGTAATLSEADARGMIEQYGESFTVFTLRVLRADIVKTFSDNVDFGEFREELRRILPLPWPKSGPLKTMLSAKLWKLLAKKASSHSLNVYLNNTKDRLTRRVYGENETRESCLYAQEFYDDILMVSDRRIDQESPVRISGFLVCDEPSNLPKGGSKLSGVITRVLNVAVDEDTFFGLEGREERKKRVAGEIFIEGLNANKAIQINRNAFIETFAPVLIFREKMRQNLQSFFSGMNRVWRVKSALNKEIKRIRGVVGGVEEALSAIDASSSGGIESVAGQRRKFPALTKHRSRQQFLLVPKVTGGTALKIILAPEIESGGKIPYRIELENDPLEGFQGTVHVSRDLLRIRSHEFNIGGVAFGLRVVAATPTDPPCAIDLHRHFVVLNEAHPLVATGDKSIIEVIIFLAYASEMADNPSEFSRHVIDLLTISRVS